MKNLIESPFNLFIHHVSKHHETPVCNHLNKMKMHMPLECVCEGNEVILLEIVRQGMLVCF